MQYASSDMDSSNGIEMGPFVRYQDSGNFNSLESKKFDFLDRIKSLRYDNNLPTINQLSNQSSIIK